MTRPVRVYLFTFIREASVRAGVSPSELRVTAPGVTPCRARGRAFTLLEHKLVMEVLPRDGWRLLKQEFLSMQSAFLEPRNG
jgi:hypothetical protein